MILIMLGLIFSGVSHGATSPRTSPSTACPPLMLTAGILAGEELTIDSATAQYLQYLSHFIEQNYLQLEDLKILRAFKKAPNLAGVFSEKIKESFIYQDGLQVLLPLVDGKKYFEFLDEMIAERTQVKGLQQKAHEETETVMAQWPVLKPFPEPLGEVSTFAVVDGVAYGIDRDTGTIRNLDTWRTRNAGWVNTRATRGQYVSHIEVKTIGKRSFIIGYRGDDSFSVYDFHTAQLLIDVKLNNRFGIGDLQLFIDDDGKLNAAWSEEEGYEYDHPVLKQISIKKEGSNDIVSIAGPPKAFVEVKWVYSNTGSLFVALEAQMKRGWFFSKNHKYQQTKFYDLQNPKQPLFEIENPMEKKLLSAGKLSDQKLELYFSTDNKKARTIELVEASKQPDSSWGFKSVASALGLLGSNFNFLVYDHFSVDTVTLSTGEQIYISHQKNQSVNIMRSKIDLKTRDKLGELLALTTGPNKTPVIITKSKYDKQDNRIENKILMLDLETEHLDEFSLDQSPLKLKLSEAFGARVLPNGSVEVYFSINGSRETIRVQVNGRVNPVTGEAAP